MTRPPTARCRPLSLPASLSLLVGGEWLQEGGTSPTLRSSGCRRGSVCWRTACCTAGHSDLVCRLVQGHLPRVEAVREAKRQVEFDFGQTQALEHHNADFNELLDKLVGTSTVLLGEPTHIDHYLSSLSEHLPAELAASTTRRGRQWRTNTPRSTMGEDMPPCRQCRMQHEAAERMVSAAGRKLGLQQHWIDFAGRKTSAKDKKGLVASIEMAGAALTQASARSLMAGYADSAASKQAAELRREFGSRIETLETGFSTFRRSCSRSTARWSDSTLSCSRLSRARAREVKEARASGDSSSSRCSQGSQQQQQQQWSQQPQWQQQQQAPQAGWQATVPAPQRQGAAAGQSWASGRKPLACWGCGGPHMERNCPSKGTVDATRATLGTARTCAVWLCRETTREKRRWRRSRRSSAGSRKCEAS